MQSPNRKMRNILFAILSLSFLFSSISAFAKGLPSPTDRVYASEAEKNSEFPSYSTPSKDRINELQIQLRNRGYLSKLTGEMDGDTSAAIRNFQKDHGLEVTGYVDAQTASLLGITLQPKEELVYKIDLDTISKTTDKDYIVYISLRSKTVTVFHRESDGSWRRFGTEKIKRTNPCAIGGDDTMTPAGVFHSKENTKEKTEKYGLEYYFPTTFASARMISSIPYDASSDTWLSDSLGKAETDGDVYTEKDVAEFIQKCCAPGTIIAIDDRVYDPMN